ncbi:MAG: hypothetical protein ACRDRV_18935 [Pseudonocardiaceae bacterium]
MCGADLPTVTAAMTYGIAGHRRRATLSVSSPVDNNGPIEHLDHVVDILNKINRALPLNALGRAELTAIGGLLTQISSALVTVTDVLSAPVQDCDRTRAATRLLRDCRDGYVTAHTSAQALHADLKRGARTRAHRGNGSHVTRTSDESESR